MLSWEYPPHIVGGLGKHVADLVPALADQGVTTVVATPLLRNGLTPTPHGPNIEIMRVEPPHMQDYGFVSFVDETNRVLERAVRSAYSQHSSFDLIHSHDWLTASAAVALKHHWRIPLIATMHATERGRGQGYLNGMQSQQINHLEWLLTYEAWRVIVCSEFMAQQLTHHLGTPHDKISMVPNGVHIARNPFDSAAERLAFRRRFATDDEAIVFYVGRIVYEKGLHILLDAWPQVMAQAKARLIIAGTGVYLDTLRSQATALGLSQHITFTGFITDEDRDRLYRVADVATFPSIYEPFGIVALEAFAAECPVVAASTGGLTEVVRFAETGITVYPDNVDSLAWGILYALRHPDQARSFAATALHETRERYNWQRIASDTHAVYHQVWQEWQLSSWGKELTLSTTNYAKH